MERGRERRVEVGPAGGVASFAPDLRFVATVALRFETPQAIGQTAEGVRFVFWVEGTVAGPELRGRFPRCAANLLIDPDGIGTIQVRAPLLLDDGAMAELEAVGRYDFGEAGYQRASALDLPNSALGWCPRLSTGDARYRWLNRVMCLGVGELRPRETSVDYDLFVLTPATRGANRGAAPYAPSSSEYGATPLYDRLGGANKINAFMAAFVDGLHDNTELHRQNPRILPALLHHDALELKRKFGAFVCQLVGGPQDYRGRTMSAAHARLAISNADWALGARELIKALEEYRVHAADQKDLLALIARTKGEIVTR